MNPPWMLLTLSLTLMLHSSVGCCSVSIPYNSTLPSSRPTKMSVEPSLLKSMAENMARTAPAGMWVCQCCDETAWARVLLLNAWGIAETNQCKRCRAGRQVRPVGLAGGKAQGSCCVDAGHAPHAWTSLLRLGSRICHPVLRDCMSASSCPTTPCSVPYSTSLRPEFRGERSCESAMKRTTVTTLSAAACSSADGVISSE